MIEGTESKNCVFFQGFAVCQVSHSSVIADLLQRSNLESLPTEQLRRHVADLLEANAGIAKGLNILVSLHFSVLFGKHCTAEDLWSDFSLR